MRTILIRDSADFGTLLGRYSVVLPYIASISAVLLGNPVHQHSRTPSGARSSAQPYPCPRKPLMMNNQGVPWSSLPPYSTSSSSSFGAK